MQFAFLSGSCKEMLVGKDVVAKYEPSNQVDVGVESEWSLLSHIDIWNLRGMERQQ